MMTDHVSTDNIRSEFVPKLVTVLREGYGTAALRADALAGLTVAIVALPLSMAIAIASGVGPERGLHTAIVGGFLVSLFGGSRYQIGGPAGAFIVLVSACVMQLGVEGLLTATFLSGFLLILAGLMRFGTYIRYIPWPVTVAFTSGIGVIILASQLKDLLGLRLAAAEPAEFVEKVEALWHARETVSPAALGIALLTILTILALRRIRPHWPGMLIAVVLASVVTALFSLPAETIGSRFGQLPALLPAPTLPLLSREMLLAAAPWAVSFALLGAIESLLSAVVADGMSGSRHRSNAELVGQGLANIGAAIFGGFCVTGTIARTATNVRAGSRGPVSGILHAVFLLAFMAVAAPMASFIPLSALAGMLALIAWGMIEKHEILALLRASRADAAIVIVTMGLVVFRELTEGIVVGFAMAGLVFIKRMSDATALDQGRRVAAVQAEGDATPSRPDGPLVWHLHGPVFFGSSAQLGSVLERIVDQPESVVIDFSDVPLIDSSGAHGFVQLAERMQRRGGRLVLAGARPEVRRMLLAQGVRPPLAEYVARPEDARG